MASSSSSSAAARRSVSPSPSNQDEEDDYEGSNGGNDDAAAAGGSSGHGSKRQKTVHKPPPDALQHKFKPFVQAAFDMVSHPANHHAVRFSNDGTAVEIIDVGAFSDKVLPRYFKHKNISSFIRQMNMYGFEKMGGSPKRLSLNFE
jgi:heat shock transcription factor